MVQLSRCTTVLPLIGFAVLLCAIADGSSISSNSTAPIISQVRLVAGWSSSSGRVEVLTSDGTWGTICGQAVATNITDVEATAAIICRQLGYSSGGYPYIAGGGSGPILEDVSCPRTMAASLPNCTYRLNAQPNCSHDQDIGVFCLDSLSPPSNQTTFNIILDRMLGSLVPGNVKKALLNALRVLQLYPQVQAWAVGRWRRGLIPRLLSSQLGSGIVQDVIQPVVSKMLLTATGSALVDSWMSTATGAVHSALDALVHQYQLVPEEWNTRQTLDTLVWTILNVTDPDSFINHRLTIDGMVTDVAEVLHTLLKSSINSISSRTGALSIALELTAQERLLLVDFLQRLDEALTVVKSTPWLPEALLSVFGKTQDSYKVRLAWGEVMLSAALALDKLPVMVDWLVPLWRTTGEPFIDSLLRSAPNDSSSQQFVMSRLQPVLGALNSALKTFYQSTGLGATISSKLGSRGYPKYIYPDAAALLIGALRSTAPEQYIRRLVRRVAELGYDVVDETPPHLLLRDGLVVAQAAIQFIFDVTSPGGVLHQAAPVQTPLQLQKDRENVQEFLDRVFKLQSNLEQLIYSVYAYPAEAPVAMLYVNKGSGLGNNGTANITVSLRTMEPFRLMRLNHGNARGVCALLVISPPQLRCLSINNITNDTFVIPFNNVSLGARGDVPAAGLTRVIRVYWFNNADNAEIASTALYVPAATGLSYSAQQAPPSAGPAPNNPCQICQMCLNSLSPVAGLLLRNSSVVNGQIAFAQQAQAAITNLATITNTTLGGLRTFLNYSLSNIEVANVAARTGFLCNFAGLCPANITNLCTNLTVSRVNGSGTLTGRLDGCTVEGISAGTPAYQQWNDSCRTDANCPGSTYQCFQQPPSVGTDYYFRVGGAFSFESCYATGRCVRYCDLTSTNDTLSQMNYGTKACNISGTPDCALDEYCAAAPATCRVWVCEPNTQALVRGNCPAAICQPMNLGLVSAILSDDGRSVNITLNAQAKSTPQISCSRIFEANSLTMVGGTAAVCQVEDTLLTVNLGPGATLLVNTTLNLTSSGSALVWKMNNSRPFSGFVKVESCANCSRPLALVSGPSAIAQPCDTGSTSTSRVQSLEIDATSSRDPSGRSLQSVVWTVLNAPGGSNSNSSAALQAAVDRTNSLATSRQRLMLTMSSSEVSDLEIAPGYSLQVTLTSWLGTTTSAVFNFSKTAATTKPVIKITGLPVQTFLIRTGIRASATVTVSCAGKALNWMWASQDGPAVALLTGTATNSQQIYIPGPVSSVVHGQSLTFRVSGSYRDAEIGIEPSTSDITFTAVGSDPVVRLTGPSGDWPDNASLVFNATTSSDPDVVGTSIQQVLSFKWECSLRDDDNTPCFVNAIRGDMLSVPGVWSIPPGLLAVDKWHVITVTVSKAAATGVAPLESSASITIRPRSTAQAFPRGTLSRVCSLLGCAGLHSTDMPLALSLQLDDAARNATVTWSCEDIPALNSTALVGGTGTVRRVAIPASVLPSTLSEITITATMDLNGVQGVAKLTVGMNSAPFCGINSSSPLDCFSVEVLNDTAPYASLVARAVGWRDGQDDQLRYEFGVREDLTSPSQMKARGSSTSTSIIGLHAGGWAVYLCAIDTQGSRGCTSRNVTILAPSTNFNAVSALSSLDVNSTVSSNDQGALMDMASQATAMMASLMTSQKTNVSANSSAANSTEQGAVIAAVTTSIATALLTSVNGSQDREQVLQVVSVVSAMGGSAAEVLPDSARAVYAQVARIATATLLSSGAESTADLLNVVNNICRLLATRLPRGIAASKTTGNASSRSNKQGKLAARLTEPTAEVVAAQSSLTDLISLGEQLGGALGQQATPGGEYIAGGNMGVFVSAAVLPTTTTADSVTKAYLRAGKTAETIAAGGTTSLPSEDAEAELIVSGTSATEAQGFTVILQYSPSSSSAVSQATAGLLDATRNSIGGLTTLSWKSSSSSSSMPTLGGDSYAVISIPAPGFDVTRSTACVLYDVTADTISEESGSFVGYNSSTGLVQCKVTRLGSYVIVQGAVLMSPPPPVSSPPPSPVQKKIFLITMLFKLSSADTLASQAQKSDFSTGLRNALADTIYKVQRTDVILSSISEVRADKTVQVQIQIMMPASRPDDGGAVEGFESDPLSKLPASFVQQFGILMVTVQRGEQNTAVVTVATTTESQGLSTGAIVGIVVGSVVGTLLLVLLIAGTAIYFRRKRQQISPQGGNGATEVVMVRPLAQP
ncbi:hypothetical protein Vafri_7444 [Volvox africanus]|uniref:SRCR domain-containing protein n=1 Tax=Volvox africanus TaxID=51714 RepID=A0A8J4B0G3_9CHLO|nr:hypothetical protein Vafri_7444 [Volvox africanus]